MNPTAEQLHAVACFRSRRDLKISAFAGAGKTTTLALLSRSRTNKGLYLAFNRAVADEARAKFPNSECRTTHSLAFSDIRSSYGYTNSKMADSFNTAQVSKAFEVEDLVIGSTKMTSLNQAYVAKRAVTRFCQSADTELTGRHVPMYGKLLTIPYAHQLQFQMASLELAKKVWQSMTSRRGSLPLGHEGYLKLWALREPNIATDYILLDEAQDTNAVVLGVLKRQACQVVYVGDKCQQIYEWRGAVNAMQSVDGCQEIFLTQSFRFGKAIADAASSVLGMLGETKRIVGNPSMQSRICNVPNPRAYLARKNATVIQKVLDCLELGRAVHVVGGTAELIRLLQDVVELKEGRPGTHPDFFGFRNWQEVVEFSETEDGEELRRIVLLVAQYGERRLLWAMRRTENSETQADLVVSTVHKAKGREWDTVQLANDFWMSKPDDEGEPVPEEEVRLFYVAITRAKRLLDVSPELLRMYC